MKAGRSNGGDSSLVYGIAVCVAILFGCLAMTAQAGRSPQLLGKQVGRTTRAVYLASSGSNATSAYHTDPYHTDDNCLEASDYERKAKLITLIFCTKKCYCHSDVKDDICYCCQPRQDCYNTLEECQAHCPVCNPTCPNGTTAPDGQQLHGTKNGTLIN
ncbi:hypothetical protein BDA96_04G032800 [Sorghum bicolor]|uniref:Uncharacterized protein n=1 Tax=Sorghum bicolor TaxID=4558 RepID=A0A921R1I5_SORBI|nr:hypothetical protein BDA96_04G032800 [Sorghum bicolor]